MDSLGIPSGLRDTLLKNAHDVFSKRIWIIDNSGSMGMQDGHLVLNHGDKNKNTDCTRWEELQETVMCHAQLSAALRAPTEFRLLNPPKPKQHTLFGLGGGQAKSKSFRAGYSGHIRRDSKRAQAIMAQHKPSGMTPLHTRIQEVRSEIIQMLPQLKQDNTKVAIVIATDGCNHDRQTDTDTHLALDSAEMNGELKAALESLRGLPVWVVIRLCTDFGPIVDFYNGLDERLDLNLDVLDDHIAEAAEVNLHNKWLNYALVIHRMREMGQCDPLFDLLDERAFTKDEIRGFCGLLFGHDALPDPSCDWETFCDKIDLLQQAERMHWNPRTKEPSPWIDIDELELADCIDVEELATAE
jgi:hypothetical protein